MPSQQSLSREPLRRASSFSNDGGSRRRQERGAPPAKNGQNHQGVGMSVRVIVRKRPVSTRGDERDILSVTAPHVLVHEDKVKVDLTKYVHDHCFGYDDAFGELDDTTKVFERSLLELVDNIFEGGTSTAFCFGQTASGKTFTLFGEGGGLHFHSVPPMAASDAYLDGKELDEMYGPDRTAGAAATASTQAAKGGVYLLAASGIYRQVAINAMESLTLDGNDNITAQEGRRSPGTTTTATVTLSMYEIKGQRLYDLLNGKEELRALEDEAGVLQLVGLTEHACPTFEDFVGVSNVGRTARTTASTGANDTSSRSHCAMLVKVYSGNGQLKGSLSLIDLAGSERGVDNDTTDKLTRKEGRDINTSLLALKEVIRALQSGTHAPFRQSRLTQVLEDSLTGARCKTVVVACVSGAAHNVQHTLNTLRYAADLRPNLGKEERAGAAALLSAAAASRHSFDGPSGLQAGNNPNINANGKNSRGASGNNASTSSGPGLRVGAGPSLRKPNATGAKPERRGNDSSSSSGSGSDVLRLAPVRSLNSQDQAVAPSVPSWASDRVASQSESRPTGRSSGGVLPENRESASLQRPSRRGSLKPFRSTSASPSPRPKSSHFKAGSDAKSLCSHSMSFSSSSSSHPQTADSTTTPATEKAPKSSSYWPRSFSRSKRPARSSSADTSKQSNNNNDTFKANTLKGAAPAVAVAAASTTAAAGAHSEHSQPQASIDTAPPPPPPASQVLSDEFSLNLDSPVRQELPGNRHRGSGVSSSGSGHRGTLSNISMESGDSAMLYDPSMSTPRHHYHQVVDADDVSVVDYGDPFFPTHNRAASSPTSTSSAGSNGNARTNQRARSPLLKRPHRQSKSKTSGSDQLWGVNQSLDDPLHDRGGSRSRSGSNHSNEDGERGVAAPSAALFRPEGKGSGLVGGVRAAEAALGAEVALRFGAAASSSRVWPCLRELGVETEADLKHVHEDEVAATAKLVGVKTVQLNKLKAWAREVQQVAELPLSLDDPIVAATESAPTPASTPGAGTLVAVSRAGGSSGGDIGGNTGASTCLPGLITSDSRAMLEAIGFGWDGLGFDLYWRRAEARGVYSPGDWPHPSKNPFLTLLLMAQYLATGNPRSSTSSSSSADLPKSSGVPLESSAAPNSSSLVALEALVNESMPTPAVLAAFDKHWCSGSSAGWGGGTQGTGGCCGIADILGLASRTFLRLGRRSEAEDTAWLALQTNDRHDKGAAARLSGASATANVGTTATTATATAADARLDPLPVYLPTSAGGATRKAGSSSRRSNANSSSPAIVHVDGNALRDKRGNEHHHPKVATRVACRCVLGDIAASEANWLVAEGYYAEALADARASESPTLEVIVCSKWRYNVLQPAGKSQADVDIAIGEACKRMGCSRDELSEVLRPEP